MTVRRPHLAGRKLVLYADVSPTIGTGHVMRLLALGQAWLDAGGRVSFIAPNAPSAIDDRLRGEGFDLPVVAETGAPVNLEAIHAAIGSDARMPLVIDSPAVDAESLASIGAFAAQVVVVDDMALLTAYPVHWVLNQNAHADRSRYPPGGTADYLLGLDWVLLRREFRVPRAPRSIPPRARRLLVSAGGADPSRLTLRVVEALGRLPADSRDGLEVQVVVGLANPGSGEISAAVARSHLSITLARGANDMADRMAGADLAVTAGGSTVWELARSGCPALVVETAPAERALVGGLERVGLFDRLGPADGLDPQAIAEAVGRRLPDVAWRTEMAALGASLVDGDGVVRVMGVIVDRED
jgi:UDP-2,4-diacetamido-2,4,6-trideoxy-beta-L-altropyranose hydrolase